MRVHIRCTWWEEQVVMLHRGQCEGQSNLLRVCRRMSRKKIGKQQKWKSKISEKPVGLWSVRQEEYRSATWERNHGIHGDVRSFTQTRKDSQHHTKATGDAVKRKLSIDLAWQPQWESQDRVRRLSRAASRSSCLLSLLPNINED